MGGLGYVAQCRRSPKVSDFTLLLTVKQSVFMSYILGCGLQRKCLSGLHSPFTASQLTKDKSLLEETYSCVSHFTVRISYRSWISGENLWLSMSEISMILCYKLVSPFTLHLSYVQVLWQSYTCVYVLKGKGFKQWHAIKLRRTKFNANSKRRDSNKVNSLKTRWGFFLSFIV